jgi:nickel-dependent lactate racemase
MTVTINYGDEQLSITLPPNAAVDEYAPRPLDSIIDLTRFETALIEAEKRLFSISEADLFVVNDAYRATPTARILLWLNQLGRLNDDARFIIATGCHPAPDESQMRKILGDFYVLLKDRVIVHDADDRDSMVEVGTDVTGETVDLNRFFVEAERIAIIGSVEPHYFAGFTGGRKSIFPGLCDYGTIVRNHNRAVDFAAAPMKLEGNPVEEHLQLLMQMIPDKEILAVQTVLDSDSEIRAVFCGRLEEAFEEARDFSEGTFGHRADHKYDIVLAEVRPPLDSNLYQLQKSLENCQSAAADEGIAILFSPCREGIGSRQFYDLGGSWSPADGGMPEGTKSFGRHKLYRVYKIGRRIRIFLYSELAKGVPERVFYGTTRLPQRIIDNSAKNCEYMRVALVRDAGHTVLVS